MTIPFSINPDSNPRPAPWLRGNSSDRDDQTRARLQPEPPSPTQSPPAEPRPDIPTRSFHEPPPYKPPPPRPRTREERREARIQSASARRLRRQQIREERARERQLKEKQRERRIRRRAERRSTPCPDLRPDWYCDSPEELRKRRRAKIRYRRSCRKRGRPPLRCRSIRYPTRSEVLDFALTLLWDEGRPNRNLLRVVRFLARDPSVPKVPGRILGKHAPVADRILHNASTELHRRFRADHIGGLRYIRRGQLLKAKIPYRWTRYIACGKQGDNVGMGANGIAAGLRFLLPAGAVRRRRFLLLPPSVGPPSGATPPGGQGEVLLCFPDGGLRVFAASAAAARRCASEAAAA